jgi:Neuraminidase (sialidase)
MRSKSLRQNSLLSREVDGAVFLASPRVDCVSSDQDECRGNLTVYRSDDRGGSWKAALTIHHPHTEYSSMINMDDGSRGGVGIAHVQGSLVNKTFARGNIVFRNLALPVNVPGGLKTDDSSVRQPRFEMATQRAVFSKGKHGFRTFRIPSLVHAANGNLIALAEGRVRIAGPQVSCDSSLGKPGWQPKGNNTCCYGKLASDFDGLCFDKDVVAKVSKDGGKTFSSFAVLSPGSNASHFYSNAIGLVDPATERVWVMYSRCLVQRAYGGCVDRWTYSDTHGESWRTAPELDQFGTPGLSGVGSGIVLSSGRLLFAKGHLMFSDTHGKTWQRGAQTGGGSEQQCVETAPDVIACASRSGWTPKITISRDGGKTFDSGYQLDGTAGHSNVTTDNCAISMIGVGGHLLLSHPNRPD